MIISASYRTDIPAFYGEWFLNRLEAGHCLMRNPYGGQVHRVDLTPAAVDGFVFWTKNVGPFMHALEEVHRRGHPFVVQHGIAGYPRAIERSVPEPARAVEHCRRIAARFGRRVVVWRYDTTLDTSLTPTNWHLHSFESIARSMRGVTDEVVISFAQLYRKTVRNVAAAAKEHGFTWRDPGDEEKLALARQLVAIAGANDMRLSICAQRNYLVDGAHDARCIDAGRLADVAGRPITAPVRGNRQHCGCHQSRDIGAYDTCPHGCIYCYAVSSPEAVKRRLARHDPRAEMLV